MSSTIRPVPLYNKPCLASDSSRNQPSFYLVGSALPRTITVDYFNSFNSPLTANPVAERPDPAWDPNMEKLCYIRPNTQAANPSVLVCQFGVYTSFQAIAKPGSNVSNATPFPNVGFPNPKLFAWSGSFPEATIFTTVTNETILSKPNAWQGLRLDYNDTGLLTSDMVNYPIDSNNAILAVGTYETTSGNISQGHTVVFDEYGGGQVQSALSDLRAKSTNTIPVVVLGKAANVIMNGVKLTPSAIPVTMGKTAYILDKAKNGSTLLYSITPSESNSLNPVYVLNSSLPFGNILTASALYNGIITYSSNHTVASFNFFDVTTKTWSGDNLVSPPVVSPPVPVPPPESSIPIAAIVGGVVGALVVIAIAILFIVRRHRRRRKSVPEAADSTEPDHLSPDANKSNDAAGEAYVQYDPGYVQYEQQGYVPYDQQQFQHSTPFFPPPPPAPISPPPPPAPISPPPPPAPISPSGKDGSLTYKVDTSLQSPTSSYVSPTSYRDSISQVPGSPESVFSKTPRSSIGLAPQYAGGGSAVVSEARSPQTESSTSPVLWSY